MTTGKTIAVTIWSFVGKVMSLLFNMLSKFVIAFLSRSQHLLILSLGQKMVKIMANLFKFPRNFSNKLGTLILCLVNYFLVKMSN